ncbi:hypothetical protein PC120_g24467 [Phytophthora cactorum]|nr:hypothetical protein PC120_g24467 [Phytophthora cactorum]
MNTQLQKPRRQTTISLATRSCRLLHSHLTARRDRPGALVQQSSQFCLGNSSVSSTSALLSSSWTITATVLSSNSSAILIPAIASSGSARPDSVIPSSNSVGVTNCSAYDQTSGVSVEGSGSAVFRACARLMWCRRGLHILPLPPAFVASVKWIEHVSPLLGFYASTQLLCSFHASLPLAPFYTDVHSSPVLCSSSLVVAVVRATSSFLLRCFSVAPSVIASIPA